MGFVNSLAAPVILGMHLSRQNVATVNWGNTNVQYVQQPLLILNRYLFPLLAARKTEEMRKVFEYFIFIYLFIAGNFIIFMDVFIRIVFGEKWVAREGILLLLIFTTFFTPISIPTGVIANISGKTKLIFWMSFARIIVFWSLLAVLAYYNFQINAFIVSQAIAEMLHLATFFFVFGKSGLGIIKSYGLTIIATSWIVYLGYSIDYQKATSLEFWSQKITISAFYVLSLYLLFKYTERRSLEA